MAVDFNKIIVLYIFLGSEEAVDVDIIPKMVYNKIRINIRRSWQLSKRFCHKQNLFVLLWAVDMDYMTISEASAKWNLSARRISTLYLYKEGRIPGVERIGYRWLLPKDAVKPADARIKSGRYIGQTAKNKASFIKAE